MSRPKGSANNPKVCMIKLSSLNEVLQPNTKVPVDINFAKALFSDHIEFDNMLDTFGVKEDHSLPNEVERVSLQVEEFN